jgi:2-C-methyl-D-erythritol 2,4-cyclodiphosphate synthase
MTTTTTTAEGRSKRTTTALSSAYSEPIPLASDPPFRIGHGFDIHRLEPGLPLVIGGVKIDFEKGSAAHSDGDALYHSVTDAILGAIGMPDIGQLFPDNDPKWKGADSAAFLKEAHRLMIRRGYKIGNVDVTLILQKPKVMGIKPQMKENVVSLLQTTPDRVNIKARTHENVDSVGESRSWVVHVVVLLEKV